jgi:hypothetical protein
MYAQPTQNVWWKYRHKPGRKQAQPAHKTIQVGVPQPNRPDKREYSTGQVAQILGISAGNLRWRIKVGKYPDAPRGEGARRVFTAAHIQRLRAIR